MMWLLTTCLVISLLVFETAAQQDLRIFSFPSPAYFQSGGSLSISCMHSVGLQFSHWSHPSDGIISVSQGRFQILDFRDAVSLSIMNAMQSDEGDYTCVYMDGAAMVESEPLTTLFRLPIHLLSNNTNTTIAAGEDLNLTCDAQHFSTRQWLRYDRGQQQVVTNTSDGRVVITADSRLQFRGIAMSDGGEYRCVLRNDVGNQRIFVYIKVVVRPVTFVTPEVQTVNAGDGATFSCRVIGTPLPSVRWRDAENRLIDSSSNPGVQVQAVGEGSSSLVSTLTVTSVDSSLTGPYTCRAVNSHGDHSSTAYLRLTGSPDPPTNVVLTLVNHTHILVSWDAPNSDVTAYVVTWEALNGTSHAGRMSQEVAPTGPGSRVTSYVITGLDRLTSYSVFVHATNSEGMGMNSPAVVTTTSATVPGVPSSVIILDVGPSSVRVEWSRSTLPADDGGSLLRTVRLTYREVNEMVWSSNEVVTDVGLMYAVVSGLMPQHTYLVKMEVGNSIGFGPGAISDSFETPKPGFPGSPSHVVAKNLTSNSAVVCWRESAIGTPFTLYNVEIIESQATGRANLKVLRLNRSSVGAVPGCSMGVKVSDLKPGTCYRFVVYVTNVQGVGQPSPPSNDACTTGELYSALVTLSHGTIAGIVVAPVVLVAVVVAMIACLVLRQKKKRSLKASMTCRGQNVYLSDSTTDSFDSRRDCEHSTMALMSSPKGHVFVSNSPHISISESAHSSPDTSTTIVSNTDQANPFDFSNRPNVGTTQVMLHPNQPVLCPQGGSNMEYPQPGLRTGSVSDKYPMYPIMEEPLPPYPLPASRNFPVLAQPPLPRNHQNRTHNYPGAALFGHVTERSAHSGHMTTEGGNNMVMTDNPNFDEERGNHVISRQHYSEEVAPAAYYNDHMSEVGSEVSSSLHIPTPNFGESYSQSGYSPTMPRRQEEGNGSLMTGSGTNGIGNVTISQSSVDGDYQNVSMQKANPDLPSQEPDEPKELEEDDTEFVDNDAYVTFGVPKFQIISRERGSVFETVKVK